jgi:hypothetical protein
VESSLMALAQMRTPILAIEFLERAA